MADPPICSRCGTPLSAGAASGACPACLLSEGLRSDPTGEADSALHEATILSDAGTPDPAVDTVEYQRGPIPVVLKRPPEFGDRVRYVGDYELLGEIARGGMGVVYRARQVRLKRVVALKMILSGLFASGADVRRFHAEAEAAAQLDHPGIVPVFEVGEHQGTHYFSMGLVEGLPLSARLTEGPLAPRDAARLVAAVARAVDYAHRKGVVHRDLKPGNILIDRDGQPKVTDFGLAKRMTDDPGLTGTGQILGTPSYMSPEQAAGRTDLTREPADIYALGAILYAALTARPPFQADSQLNTIKQVLDREPATPRLLNPSVPVDLETICLKCLEKGISQRYGSALAVAEELERFLEGRPIVARPVGPLQRLWKWCGRNRTVASLLAAVAVSLLVGTIVSTYFAIKADRRADENLKLARDEAAARKDEEAAKRIAQDRTLVATRESANLALNQAEVLCDKGEAHVGLLWMEKAHRLAMEAQDANLADACRAMMSGWLHQVARRRAILHEGTGYGYCGFGRDLKTVLVAVRDRPEFGLRTFDADTGREVDILENVTPTKNGMAIDSTGTKVLLKDGEGRPRLWSTEARDWIGQPLEPDGEINTASFSPDGALLATLTFEGAIQFWLTADGSQAHPPLRHERPAGSPHRQCSIVFTHDGKRLWTTDGWGATAALWDVEAGREIEPRLKLNNWLTSMEISRDQPRMVVGVNNAWTKIFDTAVHPPMELASVKSQFVHALAMTADSQWVVEGGQAGQIAIRDTRTLVRRGAPIPFRSTVLNIRFGERERRLAIGTFEGVELWDPPQHLKPEYIHREWYGEAYAYHPGLHLEVYWKPEEDFLICRTDRPEMVARLGKTPSPPTIAQFGASGRTVAFVLESGALAGVDVPGQRLSVSSETHGPAVKYVFVSPDGGTAVTVSETSAALWTLPVPRRIGAEISTDGNHRGVTFTDDGRTCAILDQKGRHLHLIDTRTGEPQGPPIDFTGAFLGAGALHPSGQWYVAGRSREIDVWDLEARKVVRTFGQHNSAIGQLKFGPQGTFLMSTAVADAVRLWNFDTGTLIGAPIRGAGRDGGDDWRDATDGRLLATYTLNNQLNVWHIRTGRRVAPQRDLALHNGPVMGFAPDGALVDFHHAERILFPSVPDASDPLRDFVESWTGQTLEGNDVRILGKTEWETRRDRLASSGWKE